MGRVNHDFLTSIVGRVNHDLLTSIVGRVNHDFLTSIVGRVNHDLLTSIVGRVNHDLLTSIVGRVNHDLLTSIVGRVQDLVEEPVILEMKVAIFNSLSVYVHACVRVSWRVFGISAICAAWQRLQDSVPVRTCLKL